MAASGSKGNPSVTRVVPADTAAYVNSGDNVDALAALTAPGAGKRWVVTAIVVSVEGDPAAGTVWRFRQNGVGLIVGYPPSNNVAVIPVNYLALENQSVDCLAGAAGAGTRVAAGILGYVVDA